MPTTIFPLPLGGVDDREPTTLNRGSWADAQNVRSHNERVERGPGIVTFTSGAVSGVPNSFAQGWVGVGSPNEETYLLTTTNIYRLDFPGPTWSSILGPLTPIPTGDRWAIANPRTSAGVGLTVFGHRRVALRYHDGIVAGSLVTTPPAGVLNLGARYLQSFGDRVIAAWTVEDTGAGLIPSAEYSARIRWPILGNPTDWNGPGSGFLDITETSGGPLTGFITLGERAFLFKETEIIELFTTGDAESAFRQQTSISGIGAFAPYSIAAAEGAIYFLGRDNVYRFDGSSLQAVGEPIYRTLFAKITGNIQNLARAVGTFNPSLQEYWLFFPGTAAETIFFIWSERTGRWTKDSVRDFFTPTAMAALRTVNIPGLTLQRSSRIFIGRDDASTPVLRTSESTSTILDQPFKSEITTGEIIALRDIPGAPTLGHTLERPSTLWEVRVLGTPGQEVEIGVNARRTRLLIETLPLTFLASGYIRRSSGSWVDKGYLIGDLLAISATGSNNGNFTITSLTHELIAVDGPLVDEVAPAAVVNTTFFWVTEKARVGPDGVAKAFFRLPFHTLRFRFRNEKAEPWELHGQVEIRWSSAGVR